MKLWSKHHCYNWLMITNGSMTGSSRSCYRFSSQSLLSVEPLQNLEFRLITSPSQSVLTASPVVYSEITSDIR